MPVRSRIAVRYRRDIGFRVAVRHAARKIYLESEGDEGVGEREEEVGEHGRAPAPDDELVEFQRWVAFRFKVLRVGDMLVLDEWQGSRIVEETYFEVDREVETE